MKGSPVKREEKIQKVYSLIFKIMKNFENILIRVSLIIISILFALLGIWIANVIEPSNSLVLVPILVVDAFVFSFLVALATT